MQRKALLWGGGALLVALALGLGFWTSRPRDGSEQTAARETSEQAGAHRDEEGTRFESGRARENLDRDAGIPFVGIPRPAPTESAVQAIERFELDRDVHEGGQSAGWRLGAVRRRIATAEERSQIVRDALHRLEQSGNPDAIARQRATVELFERRLRELHQEERELETQAQREGTMADVERGFAENEPRRLPPATGSGAPR